MKKFVSLLLFLTVIITFTACSHNLTDKSDIISLFEKNEEKFLNAVLNDDYSEVEGIRGVQKVHALEKYVDIQCGGSGFGSGTHYYGIFYSLDNNMCAIDVAGPLNELVPNGDGYLYEQSDGDNSYYVEPLGNSFFYYEAHF